MNHKRDRLWFTQLFVPQASQSSWDRRAELDVRLAIPSAQSACGMEITMTDRHPYYEFEKELFEINLTDEIFQSGYSDFSKYLSKIE